MMRSLGERVKGVYERGRGSGVTDLGEMLMTMGSSFETFNMKDAFVGPWDVANKVSFYHIIPRLANPLFMGYYG